MSTKPQEINHATYKLLKHYNRAQMSEFCQRLYAQGYEAASSGSQDIDTDEVYTAISRVRGIGPKRLAAIKEAVETAFNAKNTKEDKNDDNQNIS